MAQRGHSSKRQWCGKCGKNAAAITVFALLITTELSAGTQLLVTRNRDVTQPLSTQYKGLVDVTVDPGFDDARVTLTVDGVKLAEALRSPYKVTIDLGSAAVEHKLVVIATTASSKRVQWSETINRGLMPLTVKLDAIDPVAHVFEARVTAPTEDPIVAVELWQNGQRLDARIDPPYRFTVPGGSNTSFLQVTARTRSGEEAADFWSAAGEVHVENVDVRTVPIFVSVVDRNGMTRDDVDASLFKILDNDSEGKILEFGKAFDQPISIALLLDSSASMTYAMNAATRAAQTFVQHTLRPNDRCELFAIRDVPRRITPLTSDLGAVETALKSVKAGGRTALYDAISSAIRDLRDEKNRRAIVILTDGGDTTSIGSYEDVEKDAKSAGIPVYFIAYNEAGELETGDIDKMKFIAAETGGFVAVASEQNLQAKYVEIEKDLRAQFAIRYQVTDYAKHNEWRRVRVVLNSPKLTARTIRGYFAP